MVAPEVNNLRSLAAQYRSRAAQAEPDTARILAEIADELENEASKLEAKA